MAKGRQYSVMLEGFEYNIGFFVSYQIFASNESQAIAIAHADAILQGFNIISCEEIECQKESLESRRDYGVIKRYGKIYFEN